MFCMELLENEPKFSVNVSSEIGRLRAVLLHRPGVEIERMTPQNAEEALYSDILNKGIVDGEYRHFCGVFEKVAKVYYVEDLLRWILDREALRREMVTQSCQAEGCEYLIDELLGHESAQLAA